MSESIGNLGSLFSKLGKIYTVVFETVLTGEATIFELSLDIFFASNCVVYCLEQIVEIGLFSGSSLCDQLAYFCHCDLRSWNLSKLFFVVILHLLLFPGVSYL